jgi:hypothetical protein
VGHWLFVFGLGSIRPEVRLLPQDLDALGCSLGLAMLSGCSELLIGCLGARR